MNARHWIIAALGLGVMAGMAGGAEEAALTLGDLEAYRLALSDRAAGAIPSASFRDLWDRPGDHLGRKVRVSGRVARIFRQPPIGAFPALVEAWATSPAGDPFCLVFPDPGRETPLRIGEPVEFTGTYLKRLRYHGGDVDRLAPLLVGPEPPSQSAPSAPPSFAWTRSTTDVAVGLVAASAVALLLARRHLLRPARRVEDAGPPPEFVDGGEPERLEFVDARRTDG